MNKYDSKPCILFLFKPTCVSIFLAIPSFTRGLNEYDTQIPFSLDVHFFTQYSKHKHFVYSVSYTRDQQFQTQSVFP
jgi:hypothetical protein